METELDEQRGEQGAGHRKLELGTEETTPEHHGTRPWKIGARARSRSRNQGRARSGTAWLGAMNSSPSIDEPRPDPSRG